MPTPAPTDAQRIPPKPTKPRTTRETLLRGVFWRILIIEAILLVWSVGYRFAVEMPDTATLLWYVLRIVILVIIILVFMMITLSTFLKKRIIQPLEAIARANQHIDAEDLTANEVPLPMETPAEIQDIARTRMQMLSDVLKESRDRLRLVHVIRETFGRYLSKQVVDEILASPEGRRIGGRRATVTVLMSDLRGFTGLAADRDPEETVQLLNRYLSRMSEVIVSYDGIIDEFIGDAILAIFGIPDRRPDDAVRAVACAVAMQNALTALNAELTKEALPPLEMGIGINTGSVIVGNIGSELRMKYGVIGPVVNTTSRIESLTVGGQVLMGASTHAAVGERVTASAPETAMMKGLSRPLVVYPVLAVGPPFDLRLSAAAARDRGVALRLPIRCWAVNDKKVNDTAVDGETLKLSGSQIMVRLDTATGFSPRGSVKLQFVFCSAAHCFSDIYAKVISVDGEGVAGGHRLELRITAITPEDRTILDRWSAAAA